MRLLDKGLFGLAYAMAMFWTVVGTAWAQAVGDGVAVTPEQVEADWLRQEEVRFLPPSPRSRPATAAAIVRTAEDAAGAVDGMKDGTYGFHTNIEDKPWWQVELGEAAPLDRVVIFNRCDGNVQGRAGRLIVLLSQDGKTWQELYRHDGSEFFGQTDGKPLVVPGDGKKARFVRVQLPERQYFHLDEVEVYRTGSDENVALKRPADQSSTSQWSKRTITLAAEGDVPGEDETPEPAYRTAEVIERGLELADDLRHLGADIEEQVRVLNSVAKELASLAGDAPAERRRELYFRARWAVRRMALANPLLDFDDLLLVKRVPGTFTHMSDQNYGWFSRPGGGLFVLEGFKGPSPRLRCLTDELPPGSVLSPDISYDGKRAVFAYCKYYPGLREERNKLDKANIPEDAFYHLYEVNLDGSGLRRLTHGKYDDVDGRYLPSGEIAFLSTRRGQFVQCNKATADESCEGANPDCYVRCGGGPERPVAVYTLHVMDGDGGDLRPISAFEMFEWTPSVDHHGRILYARWDYVDRWNMPFMSLWSTNPDGTNAQIVFGNFTQNPHCVFEGRSIPGSRKLIFTASGHHANTGGSLVLLDPDRGLDAEAAMRRLTPEVCFPETEGWPMSYFANPYPLSENHYLAAWSDKEMIGWPGPPEPVNATGIYLVDAFGNLNLIYRDPTISSTNPLPIRPRRKPAALPSSVAWEGTQEARMVLLNVYEGLPSVAPDAIKRLRLVGIPAKTHPTMNFPSLGVTRDDPGKFVMGTVPVEADGSAYFHVPSGVSFFMQALDGDGKAVQTMRSAAYLQPGQTFTCIGCHENRQTAPPNARPIAVRRGPSKITPGPEGSWPLVFSVLVQPVLDRQCVSCHRPGTEGEKFDLTAADAYESLVGFGKPSLRDHVLARYQEGRSKAGACAASTSVLLELLDAGHYEVTLSPADRRRLITWMDTYAQRVGSFGPEQEARLRRLRERMAPILDSR